MSVRTLARNPVPSDRAGSVRWQASLKPPSASSALSISAGTGPAARDPEPGGRPGDLQHLGLARRRVARIEHQEGGPRLERTQDAPDQRSAPVRPEGHHVPWPHASGLEERGEPVRTLVELPIGPGLRPDRPRRGRRGAAGLAAKISWTAPSHAARRAQRAGSGRTARAAAVTSAWRPTGSSGRSSACSRNSASWSSRSSIRAASNRSAL